VGVSFYGGAQASISPRWRRDVRINKHSDDGIKDTGNFTEAEIQTLRAAAKRVISYLTVGACEDFPVHMAKDPVGHSPADNGRAHPSRYGGGIPRREMGEPLLSGYHVSSSYVAPRLAAGSGWVLNR